MIILCLLAAVACFVAGVQMYLIQGGGDMPTIFEAGYQAIGTYFIAKGIFLVYYAALQDKKNRK